MIKLINDTINETDIDKLIEWLKTYPRLTKGPLTQRYESLWAQWLGTKYAVFVNSGSSANLLMLYTLLESGRLKNNKIVIPDLCWATDLAPAIQLNYEPILCDCNLSNLSIDIDRLEKVFAQHQPAVFLLVSILGFSPDMKKITELCEQYGVILIEDNCESMGTKYNDTLLGNFGIMSSFSTYFGHHISTIEGGMVCTDDDEIYNLLLSIRSHGWDRDWNSTDQRKIREKYDVEDFDAFYTFYYAGMNLRSTDLQAFIGINQIQKLEYINRRRNENFMLYQECLNNPYWKPKALTNSFTSNFAYPVIHPKRKQIVKELMAHNIEVRPLICGSMHAQPFYRDRNTQAPSEFPNATLINKLGFYVPNHPGLTVEEITFICDLINSVIGKDTE